MSSYYSDDYSYSEEDSPAPRKVDRRDRAEVVPARRKVDRRDRAADSPAPRKVDLRSRAEDASALRKVDRSDRATRAAMFLQRWWRANAYRWFLESRNVELPPTPHDDAAIPESGAATSLAWHHRLSKAFQAVRAAQAAGHHDTHIGMRLRAELAYCEEVGRFAVAAQAAAVMAILDNMLDPWGTGPEKGDTGDAISWPRRITSASTMWPSVRPRWDGDRVFEFDTMIVTVVIGNIEGKLHEGGMDQEAAWKMVGHDMKSTQALADAIAKMQCTEPIAPPVGVLVDYIGFRAFCRPQVLVGGGPPAELVIGPFEEAAIAYGGPQDLPALIRDPSQRHSGSVGLLLHDWDLNHVGLRADLDCISQRLHIFGYPVALVSDMPSGSSSTAVVRTQSGPDGRREYHFRSPGELAPPEVFPDMWQARPERRLRFEALKLLVDVPPLPPTLRGALTRSGTRTTGETYQHLAADAAILQDGTLKAKEDLLQALLARLGDDGPPLSSRSWTEFCHSGGVNMRRIGTLAGLASLPTNAALCREALARAVKWLLRRALWASPPWVALHSAPPVDKDLACFPKAKEEVVALFNLVLGSGVKCVQYWDEVLVPETVRRFRVEPSWISRKRVNPRALFLAMQHHCRVHFKASVQMRQFFHAGWAKPFAVDDLSRFVSDYAVSLFPMIPEIRTRWVQRLRDRQARGLPIPPVQVRKSLTLKGYYPEMRVACSRGSAAHGATEIAARHARGGRWDLAYEVKKIELSVTRALGEHPEVAAGVLQGMTVALLEIAKRRGAATDSLPLPRPGAEGEELVPEPTRRDIEPDDRDLRDTLQCASLAADRVATVAFTWWAQLAAAECSFLLARQVVALTHYHRLRRIHLRIMSDQPILMLRAEGTFARLYAQQANWAAAAMHTGRCGDIAETLFGKTHPATVALLARFADCWARHKDWSRAAAAYRKALAAAEGSGDFAIVARLSYETARVLMEMGDASGTKPYIEQAVRLLLPNFEQDGRISGNGSALALESLHLLAKVYREIVARVWEERNCCIPPGMVRDLSNRAIRIYETYLRHLAVEPPPKSGQLSRPAAVVESIVRLKAMLMGEGERNTLLDVVEEMIMHNATSAIEEDRAHHSGVRAVQPSSDTRSLAHGALRARIRQRPERLEFLYEAVASQAILGNLDPSDWFDEVVRKMSEGFSSLPTPEDPAYQAAVSLMDMSRYFGIFASHMHHPHSQGYHHTPMEDQAAQAAREAGELTWSGPHRHKLWVEQAGRQDHVCRHHLRDRSPHPT